MICSNLNGDVRQNKKFQLYTISCQLYFNSYELGYFILIRNTDLIRRVYTMRIKQATCDKNMRRARKTCEQRQKHATCDKIVLCKRAYLRDIRLLHAVARTLNDFNIIASARDSRANKTELRRRHTGRKTVKVCLHDATKLMRRATNWRCLNGLICATCVC